MLHLRNKNSLYQMQFLGTQLFEECRSVPGASTDPVILKSLIFLILNSTLLSFLIKVGMIVEKYFMILMFKGFFLRTDPILSFIFFWEKDSDPETNDEPIGSWTATAALMEGKMFKIAVKRAISHTFIFKLLYVCEVWI